MPNVDNATVVVVTRDQHENLVDHAFEGVASIEWPATGALVLLNAAGGLLASWAPGEWVAVRRKVAPAEAVPPLKGGALTVTFVLAPEMPPEVAAEAMAIDRIGSHALAEAAARCGWEHGWRAAIFKVHEGRAAAIALPHEAPPIPTGLVADAHAAAEDAFDRVGDQDAARNLAAEATESGWRRGWLAAMQQAASQIAWRTLPEEDAGVASALSTLASSLDRRPGYDMVVTPGSVPGIQWRASFRGTKVTDPLIRGSGVTIAAALIDLAREVGGHG